MIVHIFNGKQIHLVSTIAKGFITVYSDIAVPFIVIIGGSESNKKKYVGLFKSHNYERYKIVDTLLDFGIFVRNNRKKAFLFHGGEYEWFITTLMCGAKNVNWICWGAGSSIGNNWKSKLMTPVKIFIYHRFSSIRTLMVEDKESLVSDFHLRPERIQTISYASSGEISEHDALLYELLEEHHHSNTKPTILLGNSPREMNNYIKMIKTLAHLKGKIRIQCMNNYSLTRNEKYNHFVALGIKTFGDDFRSNEEFYSEKSDYIKYMNTCDVYICCSNSQTGLGAIQTCLMLGKKIYIHGKNLSWLRNHYGVEVFDTDMITDSISYEELVNPLNMEDKRKNYELILKDRKINVNLWRNYLSEIDMISQ